jgi:DUF1365 family protein
MLREQDTSDEALRRQLEGFRAMTPNERLAIALAMSDDVRRMAEAGIRDRHPSFTDRQVANALARMLLGPELADTVERARLATTR